ncbi:MAG: PLP-dependent aminotransferase family protein [Gordonia sp. (in: high G+C Gram-positive bacteria)]|uniref:aminotransferase-like domain-containing protein n=1 Tax=Gordonia sp. (in: high G+C Gram-positive bacteria) TaxID=84139 RepID=UPI0039E72164
MTKLVVDPGTRVAVESPTYLAALQVFRFYGARFVPLDVAADAALTYVVPTFANPTGACLDTGRRDELAAACLASGSILFEDDPYRELAYDDVDRTPIAARTAGGDWVYQGSFSKTFAPGLRIGFLAASESLFGSLMMLKQAVDLHSSRLSQRIVYDEASAPGWDARLSGLASFYRERRDAFEVLLHRHLGDLASWQTPSGGLFHWLRLHRAVDTRTLLDEAIARGVAFMPGEEFYPNEPERGTLRLNFSHADSVAADRGLAILAEVLREAGEEALMARSSV